MAAFLVHYVFLFALALWVGGGAAISFIVAPAVFDKAGSRRLAGEIVGQILRRFDISVLVAGPIALLLAAFLAMGGTVGPSRTLTLQLGLVAGMLGLALYSKLALTPEIRRLRDQLGDQIDQIPREDPRRRAFGRLHGFSVLCLLGEIVLGAFAMGTTVMLLTASGSPGPHS